MVKHQVVIVLFPSNQIILIENDVNKRKRVVYILFDISYYLFARYIFHMHKK